MFVTSTITTIHYKMRNWRLSNLCRMDNLLTFSKKCICKIWIASRKSCKIYHCFISTQGIFENWIKYQLYNYVRLLAVCECRYFFSGSIDTTCSTRYDICFCVFSQFNPKTTHISALLEMNLWIKIRHASEDT